MKVNYVLLYGTPYLKYKLFDTFEKMSDFIVKRSIVNYTIFEKMEDKKEVEMIYRDSDIHILEKENERLNNIINELEKQIENQAEIIRKQSEKIIPENLNLHNRINKAIEYIEKYVENECIYKGMTQKHNNKDTLLNILRGEVDE